MAQEWEIKGRSPVCTATGREFAAGEYFYTLLFSEKSGLRREDWCEEAYREQRESVSPFSFWRSTFEPPPPPDPEPIERQTAETLLRRYMDESGEEYGTVRYFLALMLERRRVLKPVERREEGGRVLQIYLHGQSGEIFIVPDPQLRLDQLEAVQAEVMAQLG